MKALEQIERLKQMDNLISKQCTGSPSNFAQKLGISKSYLYEELGYLKSLGLNVRYSRTYASFLYSNHLRLKASLQLSVISMDETQKINGGEIILRKIFPSTYTRRKDDTFAFDNENKQMLPTH